MQFRAAEYYQGSVERMRQALMIHKTGGSSALAIYCGGLAVECMLRAFRWREDTSFEGHHDLDELLKASKLMRIDDEQMRAKGATDEEVQNTGRALRAAMNEIVILWHNNLRFASEASLRAHLNRLGRLRGIRGDALKKELVRLIGSGANGSITGDGTVATHDKVSAALKKALNSAYIHLEIDGGVSGFVVSSSFKGKSSLDRQNMIEQALAKADSALAPEEQREIVMIAAMTPEEFNSVGAPIRIHRIKEMAGGTVEIMLHGKLSDAEYVRGLFNNEKGVETSQPRYSPGTHNIMMSFRAKGAVGHPLTKAKAKQMLEQAPYLEVMSNA